MAVLHTDEDLKELKEMLSKFFVTRADRELSRVWDEESFNQATLDNFRSQHLRTPLSR